MNAYSGRTNANLMRLRKSDDFMESHRILETLLSRDEALDEVAEIWASKIKPGTEFASGSSVIADLLCKTKSLSLYKKLSAKNIPFDICSLVKLYECEIPDQKIERRLVDYLYQIAGNEDDAIFRKVIIDGIIKVGTVETLPVLEAILWDNTKTLGAKVAIADAVSAVGEKTVGDMLTVLQGQVAKKFVNEVAEAIESVKRRAKSPYTFCSGTDTKSDHTNVPIVSNAHFELKRARSIVDEQPDVAIMCVRRGTEAIAKHLYRHIGLEESGKSAERLMLGALMKHVHESGAPRVFKELMDSFQSFGNFASHDQDQELEHFNYSIAKPIIDLFQEALKIYENWLRQSAAN